MKKRKILGVVLCLSIIILWSNHFEVMATEQLKVKSEKDSEAANQVERLLEVKEDLLWHGDSFFERRQRFRFERGYFSMRVIEHEKAENDFFSSFFIPGNRLTVFYQGQADTVKSLTIEPQSEESSNVRLPLETLLYLQTEVYSMLLGQAYQYRELGSETIEKRELVYPIRVTKVNSATEPGFMIHYRYPKGRAVKSVQWLMGSAEPMIDFEKPNRSVLFNSYDLSRRAVLAEKGYYYQSSLNYQPSSENSYFLIPSPYLANSFLGSGGSRMAEWMGQVLLELAGRSITETGYFPVAIKSSWLAKDYHLPAGYFDDRWNADLALSLMKGYQKFGHSSYRQHYLALLDFFMEHVDQHSFKLGDTEGVVGLLTSDFSYPNQSYRTHTSLNHQLAVITMFYQAYEQEKDERYLTYARHLTTGVELVGEKWLKPDNSLYYARMTDGTMGMKDYPTLTYNDLKKVQTYLLRVEGQRSIVLQKLINQKEIWLREHGYLSEK